MSRICQLIQPTFSIFQCYSPVQTWSWWRTCSMANVALGFALSACRWPKLWEHSFVPSSLQNARIFCNCKETEEVPCNFCCLIISFWCWTALVTWSEHHGQGLWSQSITLRKIIFLHSTYRRSIDATENWKCFVLPFPPSKVGGITCLRKSQKKHKHTHTQHSISNMFKHNKTWVKIEM